MPIDQPQAQAERASPVSLSQAPAPYVRRRRRPGAGRAHAAQRRAAREGPPRLPVRRLARDGEDLDGEDPRGLPELRARPHDRPLRRVRIVSLDRARLLARRDRDGRRVEQLGRRHPRAARERRLLAGLRAQQGVHPRRGPHALDGRLERVLEDARGAAPEHGLRARHDRGAEGAGDGRRPLPPLRLPPPHGRADRLGRAPRRAAESIEIPPEAVAAVARSATGSFRDALGTLEQLLTYSGNEIALADVLAVLGVADAGLLEELVDAVDAGDAQSRAARAGALRGERP